METEQHPLSPFLPENARLLMLGSFPPKREKWSMEFFYPNFINDMWRIVGIVFFSDRSHFIVPGEKRFDRERIIDFCHSRGIALFDSATEVIRLKDNASDKFLEVVTPTDLKMILQRIPSCKAIVTTGQKATDIVCSVFGCAEPAVGNSTGISADALDRPESDTLHGIPADHGTGTRVLRFYRMPSSSRAYPLSLEKKAEIYRRMFMLCLNSKRRPMP